MNEPYTVVLIIGILLIIFGGIALLTLSMVLRGSDYRCVCYCFMGAGLILVMLVALCMLRDATNASCCIEETVHLLCGKTGGFHV